MELVSKLSGHWLEIAAALYLLGMILYGHHKGFIRLAVSAAALLITLTAVNYALPYVTKWLKEDTPVYEMMKEKVAEGIGLDEMLSEFGQSRDVRKEDEWKLIDELPLPKQFKKMLTENNNSEVYKIMGVGQFEDYIGGYVADTILRAAVFIVMFLILFIALQVLVFWLDLIAKLPILSGINQIAGAILGAMEALVFIWIACLMFTALSRTGLGEAAMEQIAASPWLSWIYDHNVLLYLILGLIRGI
ncbi:MAG: CvpA family protein [Lachnospiraceae bacterium]|nr:CvpA family protein [Lachnospiraceae bacterium]